MPQLRWLWFDSSTGEARLETVELGAPAEAVPNLRILGPLDYGVSIHFSLGSWRRPPLSPSNPLVLGRGVFAGSRAPGSHRLAAVFRSPQTRGLHASSLGGAGHQFMRTGLHGLVVTGWSEEPQVLVVDGRGGRVEAWSLELGWDLLWEIWRHGHRGHRGTRGLALYLAEKLDETVSRNGRIIVTGPAAARTLSGGLFAPGLRRGKSGWSLDPAAMDSASRGGGGTVLLRAHGIAAIAFGGDHNPADENPKLADTSLLDEIVKRRTGRRWIEVVREKTRKYRYDPSIGAGGTYGVNYPHYRDLIPFLGYNSIYLPKTQRTRVLDEYMKRCWSKVVEELFPREKNRPPPWGTCGEPCPVACKKVYKGTKIDYEPAHAASLYIGVFNPDTMKELVDLADELGIDAIEAGHITAWLLDLTARGLLHPEELGLPTHPHFDPTRLDPDRATQANAEAAKHILKGLIEQRNPILTLIATRGLRAAAQALNQHHPARIQMHNTAYQDPAVYAAHGDQGYMTPNYYWSPGVVAPLPMLGRYWTMYSPTFSEPEAYAEAAIERARLEYLTDNAGFCRFHRGWLEPLLEDLYREIWNIDTNLRRHATTALAAIYTYQTKANAEPRPWETKKTIDMIAAIAAETGHTEWALRILEQNAAKEWWNRFHQHVLRLLGLNQQEEQDKQHH